MKPQKLNLQKRTIVMLNEQMELLGGGNITTTQDQSKGCPTQTQHPNFTCPCPPPTGPVQSLATCPPEGELG